MKNSQSKIVVQIGLDTRAELTYLTTKPEKRRSKNEQLIDQGLGVPSNLLKYDYRFFGVDISTGSIDFCARRYWENPDHTFICAAIVPDEQARLIRHSNFQGQDAYMYWGYSHWTAGITLNELFRSIGGVDVLFMDIEGCEYEIFAKYDWEYKPDAIILETHAFVQKDTGIDRNTQYLNHLELEQSILDQGYEIFMRNKKPKTRPLTDSDNVKHCNVIYQRI